MANWKGKRAQAEEGGEDGSLTQGVWAATLLGAIAFYTVIPLPTRWRLEFQGIARWVVIVGLLIGAVLGGLDAGLAQMGMPIWVRSGVVVMGGIALTGGLHLDGAMDTADGLAVLDPQRRLHVMADSHTGAFGVMAAIAILLLKTVALAHLTTHRWLMLMLVAGWGRWGQLVAIVWYPYLKATGKGALHKAALRSRWEAVPSLLLLLGLSAGLGWVGHQWTVAGAVAIGGSTIAILTGAYFDRQLGGHTGDTYGAVVEWTEALLLCGLTSLPL